eukprot:213052_1
MQSLIINVIAINYLCITELVSSSGGASRADRFSTPSNWNMFKTQISSHYGKKSGSWEQISAAMDVDKSKLGFGTDAILDTLAEELDRNGYKLSGVRGGVQKWIDMSVAKRDHPR